MLDDSAAVIARALKEEDMASSDEEVVNRADRGSADEDDESVDEDFHADSESDVAEEYDSAHESSGSDVEMGEAGDDGNDSDPPVEEARPKKKAKTSK
jgi:structure-specific recognition protein 1